MKENKINYKLINLTALMLLLYITVTNVGAWLNIVSKIVQIILPFIIAFTIAYALTPIVRWLQAKGLPKGLAVTLIVLIFVLLIVFIVASTLPLIYDQLITLSKNLGEVLENIGDKFNLNLGGVEDNVSGVISNLTKNIGNIVTTGTNSMLSKSFGFLGNFIVAFVAGIYFISYMDDIRSAIKEFLISKNRKMFKYVSNLDMELGNYVKGLMTFMLVEFVEYSILFRLVNHPNWLILGILACLMTVIPYFGGLITNIIALILASVAAPFTFIGTLIICIVFPQLDGYFTSPRIYGKTNNVNPLITIMAVSVGGTIAGPIGIIAALPIYILLRATYNFFKKDIKEAAKSLKETI